MEPMTVGEWLLVNLQKRDLDSLSDEERYRSADVYKSVTLRHIEAWCGPGLADLRAIAESEGEEHGVSEKWLRKRRGDLVKAGATAADVDALTMPEFFLATTGRRQVVTNSTQAAEPQQRVDHGSEGKSYFPSELHREMDVSPNTFNKYAKLAGVGIPTAGDRNHKFDDIERRKVLTSFLENSRVQKQRDRARELLESSISPQTNLKPAM